MTHDAQREAYARIIYPDGWDATVIEDAYYPAARKRLEAGRADALAKASAILALQTGGEGWQSASDAPDGWHRTYRLGESGSTIAYKRTIDGFVEWCAPDGRTTVTHGSYAEPTHYLAVAWQPLPASPMRGQGVGEG